MVSDEKSKLSLSQIYEQEYQSQTGGAQGTDTISKKLQKSYNEVEKIYRQLVKKLDALCSAHCVLEYIEPEARVVSNVASIEVEESALWLSAMA